MALNDIWYTEEIKWFSILIFFLFVGAMALGGYLFLTNVVNLGAFQNLFPKGMGVSNPFSWLTGGHGSWGK